MPRFKIVHTNPQGGVEKVRVPGKSLGSGEPNRFLRANRARIIKITRLASEEGFRFHLSAQGEPVEATYRADDLYEAYRKWDTANRGQGGLPQQCPSQHIVEVEQIS